MSETSTAWRAILPTGELVDPGTEDTLKYDGETATPSGIRINTEVVNDTGDTYTNKEFETLVAADGVGFRPSAAPWSRAGRNRLGSDHMCMRSNGEMFPLRGGLWTDGSNAGVFYLRLRHVHMCRAPATSSGLAQALPGNLKSDFLKSRPQLSVAAKTGRRNG